MGFFIQPLCERVRVEWWNRLLPFFANNRRDGARLLSSALVILTVALTQLHQTWGKVITIFFSALCLYWGFAYRRLDR